MAVLPKVDSDGLRLAKSEGAKRVSSVLKVTKEGAPPMSNTVSIELRITPAMLASLDTLKVRGGYRHRSDLIRSLLLAIINDDAKAHGETPLEEAA